MSLSHRGFSRVVSYLICVAHWRKIRRELWIIRAHEAATIDNQLFEAHKQLREAHAIRDENWKLGELALNEARERWRKENEVQSPRSSEA